MGYSINYKKDNEIFGKIENLRLYLVHKAIVLKDGGKDGIIRREWNRLDIHYLNKKFYAGEREFWGVVVNDRGIPIKDKKNPRLYKKIIESIVGIREGYKQSTHIQRPTDKDQLKIFKKLLN